MADKPAETSADAAEAALHDPNATATAGMSSSIEPPTVTHWTEGDGDDFSDRDSSLGDEDESSTASISASILEYRTIHGRTFHAQKGSAEYWGPNDARQSESMDTSHYSLTMMLDDKLHLAPLPERLEKVLDVGTGTGIWAIEFGDEHPEAEVIGTDLSPIQPSWVPPNVKFEIDDATQPWTYKPDTFDFIHIRCLYGSIADWDALYAEAFNATKPGGYVESVELSMRVRSDDNTIVPGMAVHEFGDLLFETGKKIGRSMSVVEDGLVLKAMEAAGFVDIMKKEMKVPSTGWPKDERLRQVGIYNHFATEQGLEGFVLYLLTQILGWENAQVQLFIARIRKELRSKSVHPYVWVHVIYGRKPKPN